MSASILPIIRTVASNRIAGWITAALDENKNGLLLLSFYQSNGISKNSSVSVGKMASCFGRFVDLGLQLSHLFRLAPAIPAQIVKPGINEHEEYNKSELQSTKTARKCKVIIRHFPWSPSPWFPAVPRGNPTFPGVHGDREHPSSPAPLALALPDCWRLIAVRFLVPNGPPWEPPSSALRASVPP